MSALTMVKKRKLKRPEGVEGVERVYTVDQVAQALGYHPNHIREMCQGGQITAFKLPGGRKWLISQHTLDGLTDMRRGDGSKTMEDE